MSNECVAVLGCGGWGTALAVHLAKLGHRVNLWGRNDALVAEMTTKRVNEEYLSGTTLPELVKPTVSLEFALRDASFIVAAVPSHGTRGVLRRAAPHVSSNAIIVSATKGFEADSLLRMSEVIKEELGSTLPLVVLSGPSFSNELVRGVPTAVSVAGSSEESVVAVQDGFRSSSFRLYATDDVIGVEVGGAMKNVIAIAAGTVESLGLGHNAIAALITRGLAEMSRLAVSIGGRRETLAGLSGLGDLVLTCTGAASRNRSVGIELGKGRKLPDILLKTRSVAEGVRTATAGLALGSKYGVELPITAQMVEVLAVKKDPKQAVEALMLRRQRSEVEID